MVIPGISFDEVTEGLLGTPSPGAIGIVLVGTACKGPITPQFFGSDELPKLVDMYGPADPYHYKDGNASEPVAELTLTRAAIQIFQGGPPPGGVWVKRIVESGVVTGFSNRIDVEGYETNVDSGTDGDLAGGNRDFTSVGLVGGAAGDILTISSGTQQGEYVIKNVVSTTITVEDYYPLFTAETTLTWSVDTPIADGNLKFTAKYPGQWYNNTKISVKNYEDLAGVANTGLTTVKIQLPSNTYYDSYIDSGSGTALRSLFTWFGKTLEFEIGTPNSNIVPTAAEVLAELQANTILAALFDISLVGSSNGDRVKDFVLDDLYEEAVDTGGRNWSSDDSAVLGSATLITELNEMLQKDGRFLVIAGSDENLSGYQTTGIAHAKSASLQGQDAERLFFTGTDNYSTEALLVNAINSSPYPLSEPRTIHVTPGIEVTNDYYNRNYGVDYATAKDPNPNSKLSGGYAAARAAGVSSAFVPDESPLYKNLGVSALEFDLSRTSQKIAINKSFMVLAKNAEGKRVIKRALTSAGKTHAFFQAITRIAVDDIRYALRVVGNGFLGKKNTPRIRGLLQEKLSTVMDRYVGREIINTGYTLSVFATRAEQIIGKVVIKSKFQVVFYMEFLDFELILE